MKKHLEKNLKKIESGKEKVQKDSFENENIKFGLNIIRWLILILQFHY